MYNNFLYDPYRLDNAESHSLAILFHCNGSVSLLPWFIVFFCRFYLFPPRRWVQPLVGITNYTGSTLISDHIIDIYNYFIQDPYRLDCVVSYSLAVLFQNNGAVSPPPWVIVVLSFLFVSSLRMSATIFWYWRLHWKYFSG